MIRKDLAGAYSKKYLSITKENLKRLEEEHRENTRKQRERVKLLSKQTKRLKQKQQSEWQAREEREEKRRLAILEERRLKQQKATTKFQRLNGELQNRIEDYGRRKPIRKTQAPKKLKDGLYNIRGLIVEVKDGKRIDNTHKPSFRPSIPENDQRYTGNIYLNSHLDDLIQQFSRKPIEAPPDTISPIVNEPFQVNESNSDIDSQQQLTSDDGSIEQCQLSTTSASTDSLNEEGHVLKSSLKQMSAYEPNGSISNNQDLKRKVTFSSSIEFNDGFTFPLLDMPINHKSNAYSSQRDLDAKSGDKIDLSTAPSNISVPHEDPMTQLKGNSYPDCVEINPPLYKQGKDPDDLKEKELQPQSTSTMVHHTLNDLGKSFSIDSLETANDKSIDRANTNDDEIVPTAVVNDLNKTLELNEGNDVSVSTPNKKHMVRLVDSIDLQDSLDMDDSCYGSNQTPSPRESNDIQTVSETHSLINTNESHVQPVAVINDTHPYAMKKFETLEPYPEKSCRNVHSNKQTAVLVSTESNPISQHNDIAKFTVLHDTQPSATKELEKVAPYQEQLNRNLHNEKPVAFLVTTEPDPPPEVITNISNYHYQPTPPKHKDIRSNQDKSMKPHADKDNTIIDRIKKSLSDLSFETYKTTLQLQHNKSKQSPDNGKRLGATQHTDSKVYTKLHSNLEKSHTIEKQKTKRSGIPLRVHRHDQSLMPNGTLKGNKTSYINSNLHRASSQEHLSSTPNTSQPRIRKSNSMDNLSSNGTNSHRQFIQAQERDLIKLSHIHKLNEAANENVKSQTNKSRYDFTLDKTPTEDEIDSLWQNVQNCLNDSRGKNRYHSKESATPYNANSNGVGNRFYKRGQVNSAPVNRTVTYPQQQYQMRGGGSNLIRYDSLETISTISSIGNPPLLPQRAKKKKQVNGWTQSPKMSRSGPVVSSRKSRDVSDSLISFMEAETYFQEPFNEHRANAVLDAYYARDRNGPSLLSMEENKVLASIERLNSQLLDCQHRINTDDNRPISNEHKMKTSPYSQASEQSVRNHFKRSKAKQS